MTSRIFAADLLHDKVCIVSGPGRVWVGLL